MKILITGGAGFIGRHLTSHLQSAGHWVRWLDNLDPQIHGANAVRSPDYCRQANDLVLGDVCVREDWQWALQDVDAVFHLAAQTGTGQSMYRIAHYTDVNIGGTSLLWDVLANEKTKVKRVIVASSRSIYGEGAYECLGQCEQIVPEPRSRTQLQLAEWEPRCPTCGGQVRAVATPEKSMPRPASLYACTKSAQESISLTMGRALGVSTLVFRFQNVYGPGQSLRNPYTGIISIFSNQLRQNLPVNVYEDGNETRDFIYVDDVATVCTQALNLTSLPVLMNIGSGYPTRIVELAHALRNCWGSNSTISVSGDYRIGDVRNNWADTTLLRRFFPNWQVTTLNIGLEKFVQWAHGQSVFEDRSQIAVDELKSRNLGH